MAHSMLRSPPCHAGLGSLGCWSRRCARFYFTSPSQGCTESNLLAGDSGGDRRCGKKQEAEESGPVRWQRAVWQESEIRCTDAPSEHSELPEPSLPAALSTITDKRPQSYYRPRTNIPVPTIDTKSTLPSSQSRVSLSFHPDTFNLGDEKSLSNLNQKQLKALCGKYDVDTARANADMVANLRAHYRRSRRPLLPPSTFPSTHPAFSGYPMYPYYFNYAHVPQNPPPTQ
ncbi:hypothetical protein C8R43DRAFT_1018273 [Mycena crocata]|nr:hypothetical protein C8R43DRAFT_1018273 [Mycena crocata]